MVDLSDGDVLRVLLEHHKILGILMLVVIVKNHASVRYETVDRELLFLLAASRVDDGSKPIH